MVIKIKIMLKKLSKGKKKGIKEAYFKAKNPNDKIRYLGLKLLSEGYKRSQVSAITGRSLQAIGNWVTAYNKKGLDFLKDKRKTGNRKKLTNLQKVRVSELINAKTPEELGYEGRFWNIALLQRLVKEEFAVTYKSSQTYRDLFFYAGFSFHKPGKVNKNQKPHMRKRFEQEIKKNSKNIGEKMVWYW